MSVCDPVTGMNGLFAKSLPVQYFLPQPQTPLGQAWNEDDIKPLADLLEKKAQNWSAPQKLDSATSNWGADFLWVNTTQQNLNYKFSDLFWMEKWVLESCAFLQYFFQRLSRDVVETVWKKWHKRTYSPQTIRTTADENQICKMPSPPKTEEDRSRLSTNGKS